MQTGGGDTRHEHPAFPLHAIWRWGRNHKQMITSSRSGTGAGSVPPARRVGRSLAPRPLAPRPAGGVAGNRSPGEGRAAPPALPSRRDRKVRFFPAWADRPVLRTPVRERVKQRPPRTHPLQCLFPSSFPPGPHGTPDARTTAPRKPPLGSTAPAHRASPLRAGRASHALRHSGV